jgi:hypothetical protein
MIQFPHYQHPIKDIIDNILKNTKNLDQIPTLEINIINLISTIQAPDLKKYKLIKFVKIFEEDLYNLKKEKKDLFLRRIEYNVKTICEIVPEALFCSKPQKFSHSPDIEKLEEERKKAISEIQCIPSEKHLKLIMDLKSKPYFFPYAKQAEAVLGSFTDNYWLLCTDEHDGFILMRSIKEVGYSTCLAKYPLMFLKNQIIIDGYAYKTIEEFFLQKKLPKFIEKCTGALTWESYPFFKNMDKQTAEQFIKTQKVKHYLLRNSSIPGCITLSVNLKKKVQHCLIIPHADGVFTAGKCYTSVKHLLEVLKEEKKFYPYCYSYKF